MARVAELLAQEHPPAFRLSDRVHYATHLAMRYSGITYRQLRYWDMVGLARPSIQSTDKRRGKPRMYSAADLRWLREIADGLWAECSLQQIRAGLEYAEWHDRRLAQEAVIRQQEEALPQPEERLFR